MEMVVMVVMGKMVLMGEMVLMGKMIMIVKIVVMGECGDGGHGANGQDRKMVEMKVIVFIGRW